MKQSELYENFLQILKLGGRPCTTGLILTNEQVNEVEAILLERKKQIDDYFEFAVKSRLLKAGDIH